MSSAPIATMDEAEMDVNRYDTYIEEMRQSEYPMLQDSVYLDHAGTTLYNATSLNRFHADMLANLYGNPHSASPSSQRSTQEISAIRHQVLKYFDADPELFDLVFTANTTAAIKLVMEAFREHTDGFWYGYHVDSHTSLVGVREVAKQQRCFESDEAVETWLDTEAGVERDDGLRLFAYPAQSNMDGRRLPLDWLNRCTTSEHGVYTLLDAAAFAGTSPLRLSELGRAPDFTVLSFSKMFGHPDLGALIVKKTAAPIFQHRRYFAGGTVDMVVCLKEQWHETKTGALHHQLEDGTLPVHNIIALRSAMQTHATLFRSLEHVAEHTTWLVKSLYDGLAAMKHANGGQVCSIHERSRSAYGDAARQGPIVSFNLKDSKGDWVSNFEIEKLAGIKGIHIRTGGLCNPGGIALALDLAPWEMRENFSAGWRCGNEDDVLHGKPTGVIRVSLGAMSTRGDVRRFLDFIDEFFVDDMPPIAAVPMSIIPYTPSWFVESLTVYPIKSCSGWQVPYGMSWDIRQEGLAWDREWCIVHQGTGEAMSQKQHPRMALIRPHLDFKAGELLISMAFSVEHIAVPLSKNPKYFATRDFRSCNARVCGDAIEARQYTSPAIADFFTQALGVPCTLARYPAASHASASLRHSKGHLTQQQQPQRQPRPTMTTTMTTTVTTKQQTARPPILLSNESPILTISRSSLNRLNETIKAHGGKAALPTVFRANIVLAEDPRRPPGLERPWAEDDWRGMRVGGGGGGGGGGVAFQFLAGCGRCQMICVDQESGERNQEPFVTLAKTRRFRGKVLFGVHTALVGEGGGDDGGGGGRRTIKVGDEVETLSRDDE